jgi:hypothetical protein
MYYALDARWVIPRRMRRVWSQTTQKAFIAQPRREEIFSNPVFTTNKYPDWRSKAIAYLIMQSANREAGWVVEISACVAGRAPLEKSAPGFKNTSIHRLLS